MKVAPTTLFCLFFLIFQHAHAQMQKGWAIGNCAEIAGKYHNPHIVEDLNLHLTLEETCTFNAVGDYARSDKLLAGTINRTARAQLQNGWLIIRLPLVASMQLARTERDLVGTVTTIFGSTYPIELYRQ